MSQIIDGEVSPISEKKTSRNKGASAPAISDQVNRAVSVPSPMNILQIAVEQGADVEKLERLMALQERFEKNEAFKAFTHAMAKFKELGLSVKRTGHVNYSAQGKAAVDFRHVKLDNLCESIGPALSACGLSYRWNTKREPGQNGADKITVTCILSHVLGHSESTELYAFPDNSGSKNTIQAIGSTVTYLQRYTLMAATGTAATDQDDDAMAAGRNKPNEASGNDSPVCSDEYFDRLCRDIPNPENPEEIKRFGMKSLVEMGDKTKQDVIDFISSKASLTEKQLETINGWKEKAK